ncbi:peptidase S41 [Mangrovimonas yunxiaonensis]|uniref:Peptidase S41 n=1 Tax=Mangrovimonas yunxiaonensis TaxID=1197477 RepID=A0A084TKQ1_9FLAO|nr:S41 family peptidase [Mangrovimonas yunxiaonensis]KFB01287.1 peptidase S41 [Mangrovimonas yunxiaonensis]MBR9756883.1 S41 family peptidase [Algicola sp.]GGH37594.1 peptidase S41 [Mangrovimonas yunxiaonensis]
MKTFLKRKILIPIVAITIFFTGSAFQNDFFEIAKQIEIFTTLFKELNMNYVDDTNPAQLMDTAIKSMLDDLDPYTKYYNEQDVEAERIRQTGDYTGIGAKVRTLKDKLVIVEPYKDYPADKAGLKAGDEIITVNNIDVATYKEDTGDLLKGAANSTVNVTYVRQGKQYQATIKRSEIEIDAVPYFSMINDKVGYIVLSKFNSKISAQTAYAIKDLKAQGAKRLILDLRNNPGGLLHEAVNVVNLFVPKGQLVVTTKSKVKKFNKTYYTQKEPLDTDIPLVVLINGKSASASEIVSGSLQDLDRAVIVGSRSFGKGLVQRPKKLTYGTQLKVTISRYYTPSGRCIQALDYWNRDEEGNAIRIDKNKYNEFKTKNGRTVFDGGGVLPDEQMAITKNSIITEEILNDFLIFDYATTYYYKNNIENIENFALTDNDFKAFKTYLKSNNFTFTTETEKALNNVHEMAVKEALDDNIKQDYNKLLENLNNAKTLAIDENKSQILALLTDEIVKRYVYREGLYDYYKTHNPEIKKATDILSNLNNYNGYLR